MNFYTLHEYKKSLIKTRAVKEGFNWPAFLFFPGWVIYNRLWRCAVIFFSASTVLFLVTQSFENLELAGLIVFFGFQLELGWIANDIKRRSLLAQGFEERAVLLAENKETAIIRHTLSFAPNIQDRNKNKAGGPW